MRKAFQHELSPRGICEHTHNFHLPYRYFGNNFMYLCARCLGLYGGLVIWSVLFLLHFPIILWLQSLPLVYILGLSFVLTLPLVIDWWLQCKAIRHSSNGIRLITGLLTSLSGIVMIVSYQAYWVSIPTAISWFFGVSLIGTRWRQNRSPHWGCHACRGDFPHATPRSVSNRRVNTQHRFLEYDHNVSKNLSKL